MGKCTQVAELNRVIMVDLIDKVQVVYRPKVAEEISQVNIWEHSGPGRGEK